MGYLQELSRGQSETVRGLLQDAVDPHVHSGPSMAPRATDHIQLAEMLSEAGFRAAVTKDHDYCGTMCAKLIADHYGDLKTRIFSGIVLNNVVGGINPYAVEHTAATGGKIVWLPTLAAENHLNWEKKADWKHPASTQSMRPATGVPLFSEMGDIRPEVLDVLDVIAKAGLALASGHVHISETKKIFAEARKRGVERLILTHPEDIVEASYDDTREVMGMGAFVEHSLAFFVEGSRFKNRETTQLKEFIDAVGPERTILCSDLGQPGSVTPLEGMQRGAAACLDAGYSETAIAQMVSNNAAEVIGLDSA